MDVPPVDRLAFELPSWLATSVSAISPLDSLVARMRFVIDLSRENVARGTGGPFAAAVFEASTGRLVGAGVNQVERLGMSVMHAEILALMTAHRRVGSYSLARAAGAPYELVTSCMPCAMCLGAVLWSGVARVVCGARTEDAAAIGFDEGPVFPESLAYLKRRGITWTSDVLRSEAGAVLEEYSRRGGAIYNR